jgi:hypothetical protein
MKRTKKSQANLGVIENFILHVTHASCDHDELFDVGQTFTAKDLYRMAKEYIKEDHADGEDNPEDHIVTYGAESSFDHEDKDKAYPEHIVVVADFGEDVGTQTVATLDNVGDLKEIQDLLKFTANPWKHQHENN